MSCLCKIYPAWCVKTYIESFYFQFLRVKNIYWVALFKTKIYNIYNSLFKSFSYVKLTSFSSLFSRYEIFIVINKFISLSVFFFLRLFFSKNLCVYLGETFQIIKCSTKFSLNIQHML